SGLIPISFDRISGAEAILRNVRDALHLESGRNRDQLRFSEQDKVARHLDYRDADALMSDVAKAARAVDYLLELTWHRLDQIQPKSFFKRKKKIRVERGLIIDQGELQIEKNYVIGEDPIVGLRAAAAAAQLGIPLSIETCIQLAEKLPPMPTPWPKSAREELVTLIGAGSNMVRVWEALDQEGLIEKWIPEWAHLRSLPQRNVLHRHTVDRHMVETAVHAAALTRKVHRPDLLLFAALFHDIGKGFPSHDHSDYGATLIAPLAERLGFESADVESLTLLVKHHLLLSAIATRRDLDDPATISSVIEKIPNAQLLELLHALSVADGEATGRAAWSEWKATLVSNLVNRCNAALKGIAPANQLELSETQIAAAEAGELKVDLIENNGEYLVEVIAPDSTGLLSTVAGVLSITRFDVRSARTRSHGKSAVMTWVAQLDDHVTPPTAPKILELIKSGLAGQIDFSEKIADRVRNYQKFPGIPVPPPVVTAISDAATDATVIEVRMHDRPGLIYTIAAAITSAKIDIKAAIVSTLGAEAFDTLYVTKIDGSPLEPMRAIEFARELEARLK
ncbi:MAG: HD domain-containing protein, partial [Acidobacteria bacterium]|nr:HD domain-containing protein [Acidobacteriota bacterium]